MNIFKSETYSFSLLLVCFKEQILVLHDYTGNNFVIWRRECSKTSHLLWVSHARGAPPLGYLPASSKLLAVPREWPGPRGLQSALQDVARAGPRVLALPLGRGHLCEPTRGRGPAPSAAASRWLEPRAPHSCVTAPRRGRPPCAPFYYSQVEKQTSTEVFSGSLRL